MAGYRVVIALGNRTEFVTSYLGVLRAGLVAVPVNPRSATGELVRLVADCGARVVVADAATLTTVRQAVAGLEDALVGADDELRRRTAVPRLVVVGAPTVPGERSYADLLAAAGTDAPVTADPERLAVLLYTSGTSGRPRAAMLTHRALLANVEQAARIDPPMLTGDDVVFGVLPLFHVYGLNAVLGQVLHQRARLVLVNGFDMEESLAVIEDEAVTVLPVAPPVFAYWQAVHDLRERLSGVRLVLSGSAPLSRELVDVLRAAHRPRRAPGLRPHRGGAGGHLDAVQRHGPRPARSAPRCPASRSGWSTRAGGPPRGRTPARSGSAAPTCSAATGRTAPTARTPRAGTPPATSASSTATGTCSSSTGSRSW